MKKILTSLLIITAATAANAQKGTVLLGGSIDFSSVKTTFSTGDYKAHVFDFNPTIGYQFDKNWTAGVTGDVNSSKEENGANVYKINSFAAGPFIRYAYGISNLFAAYGQLQGTFGGGKTTGPLTSVKNTMADIKLFPALFINFKKSFGLNFTVGGLEYNTTKPKGGSATNTFGFTFGKEVGIGISKNFGGMKK